MARPLGLLAVYPLGQERVRLELAQTFEERPYLALDHEDLEVLNAQEALLDGVAEEARDAVEIARHVEEGARLAMESELGPGVDLEQLLERPDPARKRHERVRQVRHQRLALVHGADDAHVRHVSMGDLPVDERARDHADYLSALRDHGIRERTHQAHATTAVHHADAVGHKEAGELSS